MKGAVDVGETLCLRLVCAVDSNAKRFLHNPASNAEAALQR